MGKIKLSEQQKELIALIPKAIIDSKEITTDSAKLVLGNIIKWYNTEFTKSNGYMFRTNKEMAKDCNIHPNSVNNATTLLVINEYITKKSGKFKGDANEYTLTPKCGIKWGSQINEEGTQMGTQMNGEGTQMGTQMDKGTQMNGELINRIEQLENEVLELKKELNELRGVHKCICATESDTDSDIPETNISSNKDINNNNIPETDKPETVLHELAVDKLSVEGNDKYNKNGLYVCEGVCFWDDPLGYYMKLEQPYRRECIDGELYDYCRLDDWKGEHIKELINAIPQLDDFKWGKYKEYLKEQLEQYMTVSV